MINLEVAWFSPFSESLKTFTHFKTLSNPFLCKWDATINLNVFNLNSFNKTVSSTFFALPNPFSHSSKARCRVASVFVKKNFAHTQMFQPYSYMQHLLYMSRHFVKVAYLLILTVHSIFLASASGPVASSASVANSYSRAFVGTGSVFGLSFFAGSSKLRNHEFVTSVQSKRI